MFPIYYIQHPFFEQFKIQDKPWPWLNKNEKVRKAFWNLAKRSLKLATVNLFILAPILSLLKIQTLALLGFKGPSFATDDKSWPSFQKSFFDVIFLTMIHEFGFYVSHRLMHSYTFLYKFHKVHHEYKENIALAAQHNHSIDFVLSIALPALLALSIVKCHSVTQFQWTLWTMYANLDDHVGYSFPWSPVRWFPLAALTDEHEFHHAKNLGCFGSKLSIYNTIFGGYEHYTARWNEKITRK
jgi:sterol desaturase/sphingolipid hydroxylase (fatty acid hydroxylase superfamily)